MVHTDQAVIARIEAGKHNTGIAKYIEIADALDVPLAPSSTSKAQNFRP